MWFQSWDGVLRVLAVGSAAYVGLVVVLRASGKRTLSQLNVFDFIVTVALGSTLATILLSKDVSWLEGITALLLLTALQYVVAALSSRWGLFRRTITASPTLLLRDGLIDTDALRSAAPHRIAAAASGPQLRSRHAREHRRRGARA